MAILKGIIFIILLLLFVLLIIERNKKPTIYKINSRDDNIKINGLMVKTNTDLFLGLSFDKSTTGYYKKELYSQKDNQLLGSTYEYSLVVDNYDLYNEFINLDNSLYLRLYQSNNSQDYIEVSLKLEPGYQNSLRKSFKKNDNTILTRSEEFRNKLNLKISMESNYYSYTENNIYYSYLPEENKLIIADYSNPHESNIYQYDFSFLSLTYSNVVDNKENYIIEYYENGHSCLKGKCEKEDEKLKIFIDLVHNLLK